MKIYKDDGQWHDGPPPSIGWWPASIAHNANAIRWWNGKYWSAAAYKGENLNRVARLAAMKSSSHIDDIKWKQRPKNWPKESRT